MQKSWNRLEKKKTAVFLSANGAPPVNSLKSCESFLTEEDNQTSQNIGVKLPILERCEQQQLQPGGYARDFSSTESTLPLCCNHASSVAVLECKAVSLKTALCKGKIVTATAYIYVWFYNWSKQHMLLILC